MSQTIPMDGPAPAPRPGGLPVRNPRTGEFDYFIAPPDDAALAALTDRLRRHQPAWAEAGVAHRARVLRQWCEAVAGAQAPIVAALSADTGRHALVFSELRALRGLVEGYAALGAQLMGPPAERPSVVPGIGIETQLVPYAVVGVISPWNFPFLLSILDAIPALMAGSAVIVKPSEVTPRFIRPLMRSIASVPGLAGVLAFIEGDGRTGAALIGQSDILLLHGQRGHRAQGGRGLRAPLHTRLPGTGRQGSGHRARFRGPGARGAGGAARLGAGHRAGLPVHRAGLRGSPDP